MAIKGVILPDKLQVNKFQLTIAGFPPVLFTAVAGIEEELDNVELPDRTPATGGRKKSIEFDVTQPLHHKLEVAAMELWYRECQDPVSPLHRKTGVLMVMSETGLGRAAYSVVGAILTKRKLPDLDLDNDGEMATVVWTIKAAELLPLL